jgi:hypothetical protein
MLQVYRELKPARINEVRREITIKGAQVDQVKARVKP